MDDTTGCPLPDHQGRAGLLWGALFEHCPSPKMLLASSGLVLAVNAAWQRLWGVSDHYIQTVVLRDFNVLADDNLARKGVLDIIGRALAGEEVANVVIHYDPAEGATEGRARDIEAAHTPLRRDGAFAGEVMVTFTDVTEREEATRSAARKGLQLRAVVDNAPAMIFLKDRKHRVILANRAVAETVGVASAEGLLDSSFVAAEDIAAVHAVDAEIIATGVSRSIQESLSMPAGRRHVQVVKFPIHDASGEVSGVGGIGWDVTDRVEAERENARLQVSERAAREASKLKGDFLATVSHEIRTPLAGIIGLAQMLLDSDLSPVQRQHFTSLLGSAQRLLHVLNDILDLSRLEARRLCFEARPFDLRALFRRSVEALQPTARSRGLRLCCEVAGDVAERVVGDATRLEQVLVNLVDNAIKFSEQGCISVHVASLPSADDPGRPLLRVTVADEGIGIDPDDQAKIFRCFSQADGSLARRFDGTGLGLAICRAIVEGMDGQIGVESRLGHGATFWFTVPAPSAEGPVVASDADGAQPPLPALSGRVLLAEDNAVNQTVARHLLEKMGLAVEVAGEGAEAARLARRRPYDLILMDCHMPGTDGFAATATIRGDPDPRRARVPIVALTASALAGEMEACLQAGMDGYLAKPVTLAALHACLSRFLPPARR